MLPLVDGHPDPGPCPFSRYPHPHHDAHDARGVAIAQHVYSTERRGITDGSLSAVGLGIVAARG